MAGKKKVLVIKDVGGGLRGSSSGLRFNPREAPEGMEDDRNMGVEDPESKQLYDEKKRKEKEKRDHKIKDLRHVSFRVPNKKRPEGDNQRDDERLSELTGPASSTGAPLDATTGAKTGTGTAMGGPNIMTGDVSSAISDILKTKKKKKTEKKTRKGHHGQTKTIESHRTEEKGKSTRRKRGGRGLTSIDLMYTGKKVGNPHAVNPGEQTRIKEKTPQRVQSSGQGALRHGHSQRSRGARTARRSVAPDPRQRFTSAETSAAERDVMPHRSPYNLPSQEGWRRVTNVPAGPQVRTDHPHLTARDLTPSTGRRVHQSRVARTQNIGGENVPIEGGAGTGSDGMSGWVSQSPEQSMFANTSMVAASFDNLKIVEDMLLKAKITDADITEFKFLVRELRRLMRSGGLRKAGLEDAEHDDERPSPNAHRKVTSSPTGATSVDPDDDPRYWGAHPIGLLLPRRGHM